MSQSLSPALREIVSFLVLRRYEPGDRLPSERELAEKLGLSRGPVREALTHLEAIRVVNRRPGSGLRMASDDASIEALNLFAAVGVPFRQSDIDAIAEVRRINELQAAPLAASRRTDQNLQSLEEVLARQAGSLDDGPTSAQCDWDFHAEIVRSTQNTLLFHIINLFYRITHEPRIAYFADPDRRQHSYREHSQILDAIRAQDVDRTTALVKRHLTGVIDYWRANPDRRPAQGTQQTAEDGLALNWPSI